MVEILVASDDKGYSVHSPTDKFDHNEHIPNYRPDNLLQVVDL